MNKEILKVDHLIKNYGKRGYTTPVLKDLSFKVYEGDFIAIMGPSGSGKTTLLNMLSTIDSPTQGHIYIEGKDITKMKEKERSLLRKDVIGFLFQNYSLLDTMPLLDNIVLPLSLNGVPPKKTIEKGKRLAQTFGLSAHLHKYPYQLSGGQKQRGAACRALIMDPKIVFADEPTGALDSKSSKDLLESLRSINRHDRTTILIVTHDAFAASYANEVYILKDGQILMHIHKGEDQKEFFDRIIEIQATMGSDFQ